MLQQLLDAIKNNNTSLSKDLIDKNPDLIDSQDKNGYSILHWVICHNNQDMMKYLLDKKPNLINKVTKNGFSVMHIASLEGYNLIIEELLTIQAELINSLDNLGNTVLYPAIISNQLSTFKLILSKQPDLINKVNKNGDSIFLLAAKNNRIEIIKLLFVINPKLINIANNSSLTPLIVVAKEKQINMVKLLVSLGAAIETNWQNNISHSQTIENVLKAGCLIDKVCRGISIDNGLKLLIEKTPELLEVCINRYKHYWMNQVRDNKQALEDAERCLMRYDKTTLPLEFTSYFINIFQPTFFTRLGNDLVKIKELGQILADIDKNTAIDQVNIDCKYLSTFKYFNMDNRFNLKRILGNVYLDGLLNSVRRFDKIRFFASAGICKNFKLKVGNIFIPEEVILMIVEYLGDPKDYLDMPRSRTLEMVNY